MIHNLLKFFNKILFSNNNDLRKIIANSGWLFFDKALRMGAGIWVSVWIARYLGPANFGIYNYAIAFVALFSAFASIGLDTIVIKEIVRIPEKTAEIISSTFILRLVAGFITYLVCIAVAVMTNQNDPQYFLIIGIVGLSLITQAFDTIDVFFQAKTQSKYSILSKNLSFFVFTAVKILLILFKAPLLYFAYAYTLELVLAAIFMLVVFKRQNNRLSFRLWNKGIALKILTEGWPLIFSSVFIMVYMRIDQIMLKELIDEASVGIYTSALRLSEVWYVIPTIITASVFPSLLRTKNNNNQEQYQNRLQMLYELLTLISVVVGLSVTFLGDQIIHFLYGQEYQGAAAILVIHIWSGVTVYQGVARGYWIVAENLQKYTIYYIGIAGMINIALNFLLIPEMQGQGAALATLVANIMGTLILPFFIKSTRVSSVMLFKSFLPLHLIAFIRNGLNRTSR